MSVGVVPAVYTRYREVPPSPYGGPEWAYETLSILENYARKAHEKRGVYWVYGADEFYFLSGREFPKYEFYDDFPQFENGIGMTADFRETLKMIRAELKPCTNVDDHAGNGRILAVTGVMAYPEVVSAVNTLGIENRISAVSYTHLDVYKRQGQRQAILHDATGILGVKKDLDTPEFTPIARRHIESGRVGLFMVPEERDEELLIKIVKRTPVLESSRGRTLRG